MNALKMPVFMIAFLVVLFVSVGCGAPTVATPIPLTVTGVSTVTTPTMESPTATPTQAITLATSSEEVLGTWRRGNDFIRFDEDGTFRLANDINLESNSFAINSFQFEDTTMVTSEVSVSGAESCGDAIGRYEILLLNSGSIQIKPIEDQCRPRKSVISKPYEPVH